jgi:segregation and condensation protein A
LQHHLICGVKEGMTASALPPVKLETFEGPYDLLIELARTRQLDLSTVSLRHITDAFLDYIRKHRINREVQGDFLVVASTLLLLKIQHLLPDLSAQEQEEVVKFTDRLRMYQLYRAQAHHLQSAWGDRRLYPARYTMVARRAGDVPFRCIPPDISKGGVATHMREAIDAMPKPPHPRAHLRVRGRTLQECLHIFSERLQRVQSLIFQSSMKYDSSSDAAVSFLAILELARNGTITLHQQSHFADIYIRKNSSPAP